MYCQDLFHPNFHGTHTELDVVAFNKTNVFRFAVVLILKISFILVLRTTSPINSHSLG